MKFKIPKQSRSAFTLVELLVVMAVMALMLSLLVGASYRFVVGAREAATAATITKASGIIQDRVRAFREFDFSDAGTYGGSNWNLNHPSDPMTAALAEILFRKSRFKSAFPQAIAEMNAKVAARLFPNGIPAANSLGKYESGVVLYAVLMRGETFGASTPSEDTFTGAEIVNNLNTANLPCLVDAWGEPLRFYRWPTRLIRCGEQKFSGSSTPGAYDDINQNSAPDLAGWNEKNQIFSPAIRPNSTYPGPTPASLLISNLPPFDPPFAGPPAVGNSYYLGPDNKPGQGIASGPPFNILGAPDTDDPESLNIDPDDPSFQLSSWLFDTNITSALSASRRLQFVTGSAASTNSQGAYQDAYHDFYTFHTPLIVSSGQDKQLGLYEPTDIPTATNPNSLNFGFLAAPILTPTAKLGLQPIFDNITNLNQRSGGK